jgi:hypothetical protein
VGEVIYCIVVAAASEHPMADPWIVSEVAPFVAASFADSWYYFEACTGLVPDLLNTDEDGNCFPDILT